MICQRCLKSLPDKPDGAGIHTCTPSKLVRELEQQRDECRDTIAQQAERIKELEDDLSEWRIACEQKHEMLEAARVERQCWQRQLLSTQQELADLRKRIDDAPVVAWALNIGGVIDLNVSGRGTSLISKEDLL